MRRDIIPIAVLLSTLVIFSLLSCSSSGMEEELEVAVEEEIIVENVQDQEEIHVEEVPQGEVTENITEEEILLEEEVTESKEETETPEEVTEKVEKIVIPEPVVIVPEEPEHYSEFIGFPDRFFTGSALTEEQVVSVTDAQYLSLKKMHNGFAPYDFCTIEYQSEVYGMTTPYGLKLGDPAFPSRNGGHHRWAVMAHEQGHNFFGGTSQFYSQLATPYPFLQESLAVLSAYYTYHEIKINQEEYGVDNATLSSLDYDFSNERQYQKSMYQQYLMEGKKFNINNVLTSQALDYQMILYGEEYGWYHIEKLAKAFQNGIRFMFSDHFWEDGTSAKEQSTYIIAALNVAFDKDFTQDFLDLNFPVDNELLEVFTKVIDKYVN